MYVDVGQNPSIKGGTSVVIHNGVLLPMTFCFKNKSIVTQGQCRGGGQVDHPYLAHPMGSWVTVGPSTPLLHEVIKGNKHDRLTAIYQRSVLILSPCSVGNLKPQLK